MLRQKILFKKVMEAKRSLFNFFGEVSVVVKNVMHGSRAQHPCTSAVGSNTNGSQTPLVSSTMHETARPMAPTKNFFKNLQSVLCISFFDSFQSDSSPFFVPFVSFPFLLNPKKGQGIFLSGRMSALVDCETVVVKNVMHGS